MSKLSIISKLFSMFFIQNLFTCRYPKFTLFSTDNISSPLRLLRKLIRGLLHQITFFLNWYINLIPKNSTKTRLYWSSSDVVNETVPITSSSLYPRHTKKDCKCFKYVLDMYRHCNQNLLIMM